MSEVISDDYPEHLNPFDENYDPLATPLAPPRTRQQKYNTWNSSRNHQVKPKATLLEKPWAALNISPKGKLVRRLSVLKSAVEKFATKKKKRLEHSASFREGGLQPRSNSLHEDFNYRIISPKIKEKIRQQVFSRSLSVPEQETENSEVSQSPRLDRCLTLSLKEDPEQPKSEDCSPTSPDSEKDVSQLGARPKARKKRPPPPPPVDVNKLTLDVTSGRDGSEDNISANSSITQDLEKDALTDDDISVIELDHNKISNKNV